jgi:hypothetical protein
MPQGLGDLRRRLYEFHRDLDPTTLALVTERLTELADEEPPPAPR